MFHSGTKKNLERLKRTIERLIDSIEIEDASAPSVKPFILRRLDLELIGLIDEAKRWPPHMELNHMAYQLLYSIAHDLLCSGEFIDRQGRIDERCPGKSMMHILEACIDYYMIAGIYGESWKNAQLKKLARHISRAEQNKRDLRRG